MVLDKERRFSFSNWREVDYLGKDVGAVVDGIVDIYGYFFFFLSEIRIKVFS